MRGAAVVIGKKHRGTKVTLDSLLFTFATTSPVDTTSRSVCKNDKCLSGIDRRCPRNTINAPATAVRTPCVPLFQKQDTMGVLCTKGTCVWYSSTHSHGFLACFLACEFAHIHTHSVWLTRSTRLQCQKPHALTCTRTHARWCARQ